jgi:hypothetical protein
MWRVAILLPAVLLAGCGRDAASADRVEPSLHVDAAVSQSGLRGGVGLGLSRGNWRVTLGRGF